jgi:hypothetical protein
MNRKKGKGKGIYHLNIYYLPLKNGAKLLTSRFQGKGKGKEKRCEITNTLKF